MTGRRPLIRVEEYPHPVGTTLCGPTGAISTVIDRDGHVFLACCAEHERQGVASGYYPQQVPGGGKSLYRHEPVQLPPDWVCEG